MKKVIAAPRSSRTTAPKLYRGLYARVARKMKLSPTYVKEVALGEWKSRSVEQALEQELRRIAMLVKNGHA